MNEAALSSRRFRILLLGNYEYDRQESMQRFTRLLASELPKRGISAEVLRPVPLVGRLRPSPVGIGKWLGYIDKFVVFPFTLRRKLRELEKGSGHRVIVHICDHSNAFYSNLLQAVPSLVTCHDLLAVRGALGEATDCPASITGRLLQRLILFGLSKARYVACDSAATREDLLRLIGGDIENRSSVVLLSQNFNYKVIDKSRAAELIRAYFDPGSPFVLHVGHNLKRKNREGILRVIARIKSEWLGRVIFAGEPLDKDGIELAKSLGILDRVVQIVKPSNEEVEALYNLAFALIYPSRAEGFGWPIIEAQACGCPVICSDQTSVPEVAGEGGIVCGVDDYEAFGRAILRLEDTKYRQDIIEAGTANLRRFTLDRMMDEYREIYESLLGSEPDKAITQQAQEVLD